MVACDACSNWFHIDCVGFTGNEEDVWFCDGCAIWEFDKAHVRSHKSESADVRRYHDIVKYSEILLKIRIARGLLLHFLLVEGSPTSQHARKFTLARWSDSMKELRKFVISEWKGDREAARLKGYA